MSNLNQKKILLIVTGSIAAYRSLDLIRSLKDLGAKLQIVLTKGACEFVTPLSVASLAGVPVYQDLFSLKDETEMGHIRLSRDNDWIMIAPASAQFIAKMRAGMADDLATSVVLASNKPVMIVPAMNTMMWEHPATVENIQVLRNRGIYVMQPDSGMLACGEVGAGRMPEITALINAMERWVINGYGDHPEGRVLKGIKAVVTAGPTREMMDPVRFLSNPSTGKQGYAIAEILAQHGAKVILVSGPTSLIPPANVERVMITSADEMLDMCRQHLPCDVFVGTAAVTDWKPKQAGHQKFKKESGLCPSIEWIETPDVLAQICVGKNRPKLTIGFAAETHHVEDFAKAKLRDKKCDWILANDVTKYGFGSDVNQITFIPKDGEVELWPEMTKTSVAHQLVGKIAEFLNGSCD